MAKVFCPCATKPENPKVLRLAQQSDLWAGSVGCDLSVRDYRIVMANATEYLQINNGEFLFWD